MILSSEATTVGYPILAAGMTFLFFSDYNFVLPLCVTDLAKICFKLSWESEFKWGCDSVYGVRYNPAEPTLIAAASSDRNIILYDIRLATAVRKTVLRMKTNKIAWNPREPMNFACANEDTCVHVRIRVGV